MNTSNAKPLPWILTFIFARVLPWSVVLIGALALYIGISNVLNAKASTSWPSVEGRISKSEIRVQHGTSGGQSVSSSVSYQADIEYDYTVDGEMLKGSRIGFEDLGTADRSDAETVRNRYPEGISVTVYYKPNEHQISLLEPGLRTPAWFPVFFSIPFLLIGLALVVFPPKATKSTA